MPDRIALIKGAFKIRAVPLCDCTTRLLGRNVAMAPHVRQPPLKIIAQPLKGFTVAATASLAPFQSNDFNKHDEAKPQGGFVVIVMFRPIVPTVINRLQLATR
jgi:hypothetical protein